MEKLWESLHKKNKKWCIGCIAWMENNTVMHESHAKGGDGNQNERKNLSLVGQ